jgi:hypothetical protein
VTTEERESRPAGRWGAALGGGVIGALGALALAAVFAPKYMGERIVREALVAHPDILLDASDSLRDRQYEPVLAAYRAAIVSPFDSWWKGAA